MLLEKGLKDVVLTFKLVTGEEVITEVKEEHIAHYVVEKPFAFLMEILIRISSGVPEEFRSHLISLINH